MVVAFGKPGAKRTDARTRGAADDRAFQTTTENRTQRRSAGAPDQRSLARTDAASIVMVMPALIVARIAIIIALPDSLIHAAVVIVVPVSLRNRRKRRTEKKSGGQQTSLSGLHNRSLRISEQQVDCQSGRAVLGLFITIVQIY
ncbi:MAG: hypothetical protein ABUS51_05410 [Acidobacteriota bacterium]